MVREMMALEMMMSNSMVWRMAVSQMAVRVLK